MDKLKIGFIGLGQRGAAFGMTDGSIGLLGNVLKNSNAFLCGVRVRPPRSARCRRQSGRSRR